MPADNLARADPGGRLLHVTLPGDMDGVRGGLAQLMAGPFWHGLPPDLPATAELVLAEVLNNVAEHAYALRPGEIEVSLERQPGAIAVRVADRGAPMPAARLPAGVLPDPFALPEGGFGWHLIRTLCADLCYRRHEGWNLLTFRLPHGG